MTRKEANELDIELKRIIQESTYGRNIGSQIGECIVDNFVEFTPDDAIQGMIFGKTPASYKIGNVKLNLKGALLKGVEFCASISKPDSFIEYIQLLMLTVLFIAKASKQELSKVEAYIVYWLHSKEVYFKEIDLGVNEEILIPEILELYDKKEGKKLEKEEIIKAINHLYLMKVIEIDSGIIYLKEKVYGKM